MTSRSAEKAIIEKLAISSRSGHEIELGREMSVDVSLGDEGPGSYTRFHAVKITPALLAQIEARAAELFG